MAHSGLKSNEEKLAVFRNGYVNHPILEMLFEKLKSTLSTVSSESIILVIGPTAVGKSTLKELFKTWLFENDESSNPGTVPYVDLSLVVHGNQKAFDWYGFYIRLLQTLNEPLIEHKLDYQIRNTERGTSGKMNIQSKSTIQELWLAYSTCLRHRSPHAVILDEGQHLKKTAGNRTILDQVDTLLSLCKETKTPHILFGTYELLDFVDLRDLISDHVHYLHFPRYQPVSGNQLRKIEKLMLCNASDMAYENFQRVVLTFQKSIPLELESNLLEYHELLYCKSAGLVGVLKEWLVRALAEVLNSETQLMTEEILIKTALSDGQILQIIKAINEGEKFFIESEK